MRTVYQNTCPAWHDTKKISKDKWLQNTRGEGVAGTAKRVTFETTEVQFHDTRNIILQKINQVYCAGASAPTPAPPPDLLDGLLAYWKMEEDGAANREDSHTGNHDLAPQGNPTDEPGIIGDGAYLTGTPGQDLINSDAVFELTGQYTIAGWVKLLTVPPAGSVFLYGKQNRSAVGGGFPSQGYMVYLTSGGRLVLWHGNGVASAEADSDLIDVDTNTWLFIVCGFNGVDQFMQINNGSRLTTVGIVPSVGSQPFGFGGSKGSGGAGSLIGPDAIFDEFGIWSRVLTLTEASYLYNSGAGKTYPL